MAVAASLIEAALRPDRTWLLTALAVSVVIQAQAGQALAAAHPDRALAGLETIEQAATRALAEVRTIVGVLRVGTEPDLALQPGLPDIERLADTTEAPAIEVRLSGLLDDLPAAVGVAVYPITQEAITNARRHARHAARVHIKVVGDVDRVRLSGAGEISSLAGRPETRVTVMARFCPMRWPAVRLTRS